MLHNIRSVHNVGSIFRTADAAGVSKIILCGYTPTPVDRFGRARKNFNKVSLGAEKTVPWKQVQTPADAIKKLKKDGYKILAIEQSKNATSLFDYKPTSDKVALILGNEVRGLSKSILSQADTILEIPMRGKKESLNVSVTAGVLLFTLSKTS